MLVSLMFVLVSVVSSALCERTYLIIGITQSGKSTLGNCIVNRRGDLQSILQRPFVTCDKSASLNGCTKHFAIKHTSQAVVLDTVDVCNAEFATQIKSTLSAINYELDGVIFTVRKEHFFDKLDIIFEQVQDKLLMNKCRQNSMLVVTNCAKGWLQRNEQKASETVQRVLAATSRDNTHEFYLRADEDDADEDDLANNINKRRKAIDELIGFLDSRQLQRVSIVEAQSAQYDTSIIGSFAPIVKNIAGEIENGFSKSIDGIKDIGSKIEKGVDRAIDEIKDTFDKVGGGIKDGVGKVGDAFKSIFG